MTLNEFHKDVFCGTIKYFEKLTISDIRKFFLVVTRIIEIKRGLLELFKEMLVQ